MFKLRRNKKAATATDNASNQNPNPVDYDYYPENQEDFAGNYDENNYQADNQNFNEEVYDQNLDYNNNFDQDDSVEASANNFDEYNQRIAYYNQFENYRIPEEPTPITDDQDDDNNFYNNFPQDEGNIAYDPVVDNLNSPSIDEEEVQTPEQYVQKLVDNENQTQEEVNYNHNVESEDETMNNRENERKVNANGQAPQKKSIKKDIEKIIESIKGLEQVVEASAKSEESTNALERLVNNKFEELTNKINTSISDLTIKVNSNLAIDTKNSEVTLQLIRIMDDLVNSVEMNEYEIKNILSEEMDAKLKSFQGDIAKQNETAFQNIIARISDKLDKRFDRFDASLSAFDNEFEKISLTLTKTFTKEIEKISKKFASDIEKINNDLSISSNLTFEKVNKVLKDSKKNNEEVANKIEEKFTSLEGYIKNDALEEYDELSFSDTDIRVLKWLLSKEYAIQKDITKSNILSSLNFLANLNIIDFGWNDKIDELPVMAYWISKEKGNRIRTLLGRWEYSKVGRDFTSNNEENNEEKLDLNETDNTTTNTVVTTTKSEVKKEESKKANNSSTRTGSSSARNRKN